MSKKGYIHIAEYDLTKLILDKLDIDIDEDTGVLYTDIDHGMEALKYKNKDLILPSYEECFDADTTNCIIFKPFTNVNHANYLINLFADIEDCTAVFTYCDGKDKTLNGKLECKYGDAKPENATFNGIKSVATLTSTVLLKQMLDYTVFKKYIGSILKIDQKIGNKK